MSQNILTLKWQVTGEDDDQVMFWLCGNSGVKVKVITCQMEKIEVIDALGLIEHNNYKPMLDPGESDLIDFIWDELVRNQEDNMWQKEVEMWDADENSEAGLC